MAAAKRKIEQRGIVLVMVPLLFELIFVGVLAKMLLDARNQLFEERRARSVVTTVSVLSRRTQTAARILARYTNDREPALLEQYDRVVAPAPGEFKELRTLVKDRPDDLRTVIALEHSVLKAIAILEDCKEVFGQKNNKMAHLVYYPRLYRAGMTAEKEMDTLLQRYRAKELADREANDRASGIIFAWLAIGVLFNIGVAIILAVFFSRSITRRLEVLTDNTVRLAEKRPLSERVAGDDEIAELDRVFHRMADALHEADRLKQDFFSMVSHDLRTPLSAVQGTLTLLLDGTYGELEPRGEDRVRVAEAETERLMSLVNNLLDIERLESGQLSVAPSPLALAPLVEAASESVRSLSEAKKIEIVSDVEDVLLNADRERMMQVLINLLGNAIKFSPPDSRIEVTGRIEGGTEGGTESGTEDGTESGMVRISVRDSGKGIPQDVGDCIFERWRQVESDSPVDRGSGLGLAISRHIVEAHGGEIGYESKDGEGSTFFVRLPVTDAG
ncbi:MAG: ATP-binding protein [Candidatus Obscuribacterales bacterium]